MPSLILMLAALFALAHSTAAKAVFHWHKSLSNDTKPLTGLIFLKKANNISIEDFNSYWRDIHGPLVVYSGLAEKYLLKYEQHLNVGYQDTATFSPLAFDGVGRLVYKSAEALAQFPLDEIYLNVIVPDEYNFMDREESRHMLVDVEEQFAAEDKQWKGH